MRSIITPKGSRFLLCQLSKSGPAYPKYPPQPIVRCEGYREKGNSGEVVEQRGIEEDEPTQAQDRLVPLHRQLLPQPVCGNPVQLRGREDGTSLEGILQGP